MDVRQLQVSQIHYVELPPNGFYCWWLGHAIAGSNPALLSLKLLCISPRMPFCFFVSMQIVGKRRPTGPCPSSSTGEDDRKTSRQRISARWKSQQHPQFQRSLAPQSMQLLRQKAVLQAARTKDRPFDGKHRLLAASATAYQI